MDFERNYQIKYPSKQLNYFSTLALSAIQNSPKLHPWFVTGLADSEGTFTILIDPNLNRTIGWRIQAKFQIGLHKRDFPLLLQLQQFLGGIGSIYINPILNKVNFSIDSKKDLTYLFGASFRKIPVVNSKSCRFYFV